MVDLEGMNAICYLHDLPVISSNKVTMKEKDNVKKAHPNFSLFTQTRVLQRKFKSAFIKLIPDEQHSSQHFFFISIQADNNLLLFLMILFGKSVKNNQSTNQSILYFGQRPA